MDSRIHLLGDQKVSFLIRGDVYWFFFVLKPPNHTALSKTPLKTFFEFHMLYTFYSIFPNRGSIFFRNCDESLCLISSQQFRIRDCQKLDVHLYCTTQPVIETSVRLSIWDIVNNLKGLKIRADLIFVDVHLYCTTQPVIETSVRYIGL